MGFPILRELAKELAPLLAPLVAQELRGAPVADGWVPQKGSKLGRNNHIEAVRRIHALDPDRAIQRGKLYLLRKDVYDQELARAGKKPSAMPPAKAGRPRPVPDREEYWRKRLGASRG